MPSAAQCIQSFPHVINSTQNWGVLLSSLAVPGVLAAALAWSKTKNADMGSGKKTVGSGFASFGLMCERLIKGRTYLRCPEEPCCFGLLRMEFSVGRPQPVDSCRSQAAVRKELLAEGVPGRRPPACRSAGDELETASKNL